MGLGAGNWVIDLIQRAVAQLKMIAKRRQVCYNAGMKAKQYTIRNIPPEVDSYFRRLAKIKGKSLNRVILDELEEKSGANKPKNAPLGERLDWFFGAKTIDDKILKFWQEDDKIQKELTRKEWQKEDDNRY